MTKNRKFVVLLKHPNVKIHASGWHAWTRDGEPDPKMRSNVIYRVAVEAPDEASLLDAEILGGAEILSIREVT